MVKVHLKFHQVSPAMRMPIWIAYLALPVGYLFMFIRNVMLSIQAVKDIIHGKTKAEPAEIPGEAPLPEETEKEAD